MKWTPTPRAIPTAKNKTIHPALMIIPNKQAWNNLWIKEVLSEFSTVRKYINKYVGSKGKPHGLKAAAIPAQKASPNGKKELPFETKFPKLDENIHIHSIKTNQDSVSLKPR